MHNPLHPHDACRPAAPRRPAPGGGWALFAAAPRAGPRLNAPAPAPGRARPQRRARAQGFSTGWWKAKHNTHHAAPNELAPGGGAPVDPDIDTLPLLAWSEGMLDAMASPAARRLLRAQQYYFVPILMLARLAWAQQSAAHALGLGTVRGCGPPPLPPWAGCGHCTLLQPRSRALCPPRGIAMQGPCMPADPHRPAGHPLLPVTNPLDASLRLSWRDTSWERPGRTRPHTRPAPRHRRRASGGSRRCWRCTTPGRPASRLRAWRPRRPSLTCCSRRRARAAQPACA